MRVILLLSKLLLKIFLLRRCYERGGGKTGSIATFITFYSMAGISLARRVPSMVSEGLELASIRKGFIWSSSMKSRPKSSKQNSLPSELSCEAVEAMRSVAIDFIFLWMS